MDRLLFIVSLCFFSFLYGVVTMDLRIFPYQPLREAKLAWNAWTALYTGASARTRREAKLAWDAWALERDGRFPGSFVGFEAAAAQPEARRLQASVGQEYLLVTGGPYQLLERCPTHGCLAWITNRKGRIVHTWEVDLDQLWAGISEVSGDVNKLNLHPIGLALADDGSLVATLHGLGTFPYAIGIVKVDVDGQILWKRFDRSHHWPAIDANGWIYTPYAVPRGSLRYVGDTPLEFQCDSGIPLIDAIRVLSQEGKVVREIPVLEAFLRAGLAGLFYRVSDDCDPLHLNSVALVTEAAAAAIPDAAVGDLLISILELGAVALLDAETGDVKRLMTGQTVAQHGPQFLSDGTVLVFDNWGGDRALGGSRVARLDLVKGTSETVFPRGGEDGLLPFFSGHSGHISVSPDGQRALVAVTTQGRIIEIDIASGAPLWVYEMTHDIGPFLKANDIDSDTTRGRFLTFGAYYVRNLDFLDGRRLTMTKGDER